MFKKGQLVRIKSEDGNTPVMQVVDGSLPITGTTEVTGVDTEGEKYSSSYDTNDLELVSNELKKHKKAKPMKLNKPERTKEDIHDDVSKMFIQIAQYVTSNTDKSVEIRINSYYASGSDMDIDFEVRTDHGDWVNSSDLFKSAQIAIQRYTEDLGLKPLSIPMYK